MTASRGGIILCGGRSSRMGTAKLSLPFGRETMLGRIVRIMGLACRPIVVVLATDQPLPPLADDVILARDRHPDRGPLEGLAVGLAALPADVPVAFVSACDAPLLRAEFIERMCRLLGENSAAVPVSRGFLHPLAAVYRTSVVDVVHELLAAGRLRPRDLFDIVSTRRVEEGELEDVDPKLESLWNLNTPEEYQSALARLQSEQRSPDK